jgi:hypothetical protein
MRQHTFTKFRPLNGISLKRKEIVAGQLFHNLLGSAELSDAVGLAQ